MLIKCPECELQVSDKANSCPHCGYPFVQGLEQPSKRPCTSSKGSKKQHMRLPNGFGQITKVSGNLRKPYRAMVTVGKTEFGKPICKLLKPDSYFETYNDAYAALIEYNKNPYDLEPGISVKELYEKWFPEYSKKLKSKSSERTITSAWVYCYPIYSMRAMDIRSRHIKSLMEQEGVTDNIAFRIKSLFNLMLDYAVEYEIVDKNYARTFGLSDLTDKSKAPIKEHISFTDEEIELLWNNQDNNIVKMAIMQIYTGFRPQELCTLKRENIDLDNLIIIGGMKTKAGTDRTVPIHNKIIKIAKNFYELSESREYVFDITYDQYYKKFMSTMGALGLTNHRPHDPRKTFITLAKRSGVDEYAIKRIVGHAISDITESVYTERDADWLRKEINKI